MVNPHIALITDSTCDIPQPLLEQYHITVLPHVIIWGSQQYRDRVDLLPEDFYRRLKADPVMPTTSQASVLDFSTAYQSAWEQGATAVVAILLNAKFSGALQAARQAALDAKLPVGIHDSREVTMALGWQVLAAARVREAGGDVTEMLAAAEAVRQRVQLYIVLDTLEYVYRGGRIGNARRLVGNMLNVKPMIAVDHESGIVEPAGMAMTRRKSLEMLYKRFFSELDTRRPLHVAVLHGDAAKDADLLAGRVEQDYPQAERLYNITCPVLGIHTGPQAIALCGYAE